VSPRSCSLSAAPSSWWSLAPERRVHSRRILLRTFLSAMGLPSDRGARVMYQVINGARMRAV
jgi:hypothetical protein